MVTFQLPPGAFVEIAGQRYFHEGNGVFSSHRDTDRPHIIEAISSHPSPQNRLVPVFARPAYEYMWRVYYIAATKDEVIRGSGEGAFEGITPEDFPQEMPEFSPLVPV